MALVHDPYSVALDVTENNIPYDGDAVDVTPGDDDLELRSMGPNAANVGTEIVICNLSSTRSFTIAHDHANGTSGGKFYFSDGQNHVLAPFEQVWGVYRDSGRTGWWMQF